MKFQHLAQFNPNILTNPPQQLNTIYSAYSVQASDVLRIVIGVRNFILVVGAALVIIMLVVAGIKYMRSGGDDQKLEEAHKTLKYAIIGAFIIIAVFVIFWFIINLIRGGAQQFNPVINP